MSATTTSMTTAITNLETALAAVGVAFADYNAGLAAAKVSRAAALGSMRAPELDDSISTFRLGHVLAGRLRALGVVEALDAPSSTTPQAAGWTASWNALVTANVP